MGIIHHLYKSLLCLFLLPVSAALAAEVPPTPLHFIGLYKFDWSGIALGALELGIDETATAYSLRLTIASKGIVNLFTHHMSETDASGDRQGDMFTPRHYESRYKTKNKPRHIKLTFDNKGSITEEIVEPPEDRNERPEVPHSLKDGAYDPLGGLLMLLAGHQKFRAFNAKQLYEVYAQPAGVTQLHLNNINYKAHTYILTRTPLAGMTAKETKEYAKGEPPLTLFVSDDARRIPLAVTMPIYFSAVHGVLAKECTQWIECRP